MAKQAKLGSILDEIIILIKISNCMIFQNKINRKAKQE